MTYSASEKHDVQVNRATRWAGGSLRLLSAASAVVAAVPFDSGAAGAVGSGNATLTFASFPKTTTPNIVGTAIASADIVDSGGSVRKSGLTVGLSGSGAQVILSKITPVTGDSITVQAPFTLTEL